MALPTNGFAIHQIEHPEDPQVNGFGLYRTIDGGSSVLLDQRIQIPVNNEYAVTQFRDIRKNAETVTRRRRSMAAPQGGGGRSSKPGRSGTRIRRRHLQASDV